MPEALLLAAALLCSACGMAWLALSMKAHWQQVHGEVASSATTVGALRLLAALALVGSLLLCLSADHASMAALVWVMTLTASALSVAFALTWRPRWLSLLVPWVRGGRVS